MPRKTFRRKSFRRRRTPWYRKKYNAMQLAMKAVRGVNRIRGLVNSERMYVDNSLNFSAAKTNVVSCQQLAIGDLSGQRTGNSVLARSLYIRAYININPAVTLSSRVSVVLVQDKQQIADVYPTVTDVFTSTDPEAQIKVGASNNVGGRFKIIWRRNYTLIPGQRPTINIDKYFKLYSHIKYNGASIADLQKNGYYLMTLTSESTNFVTMNGNARLGYHDN